MFTDAQHSSIVSEEMSPFGLSSQVVPAMAVIAIYGEYYVLKLSGRTSVYFQGIL